MCFMVLTTPRLFMKFHVFHGSLTTPRLFMKFHVFHGSSCDNAAAPAVSVGPVYPGPPPAT
jgi:hypothetical protein